ncbi:MAG: hypothetical protein HY081_00470 [Gammaproteobacteria bacterium]|nr:hypothetical protein [Gammaproteobacteria bacterium]
MQTALNASGTTTPPVAAAPTPVPPTPSAKLPRQTAVAPAFLPSVTASGPASSYDTEALALMDKSRAALAQGDNKSAISSLDKLLRLPPNRYSQDAQEYIGLARQRAGETTAAKNEYQLYLRLYPEGEGADRVRQRLAALEPTKTAVQAPTLKVVKPKTEAQSTIIGNLSQFYFHGASKVDTTTLATGTNPQTQAGLTQTDQSAIVTNLNLTHRYRSDQYDNRFVFRDTFTRNFIQGQDNSNRPSAIYYDVKDRKLDYTARVGRQPGGTAGVLGRFDGLLAGYNFNSKWKINAAAGIPTDISYDSHLSFQGMGLDLGPFADHWGGSVYTIRQKVDGVIDRNALGSELRYFSPSFSIYSLFDYDTGFQDSNIAMIQGNWTATNGTSAHMLLDRRKTPSLGLVNALIGEADTSIKSQLQTKTYDQLKQQAKNQTATNDSRNIGITQPMGTHWQMGLDMSTSHTSSTVGTATSPGLPDSGTTRTYTSNFIGTGLFSARDVSVLTYSRTNAPTSTGNLYALTNRLLLGANWEWETTLSWFTSHETTSNSDSKRFSPTIKPRYKWKENITLEAEFGEEHTDTTSPTTTDKNTRRYWSIGYRWDF